MRDLQRKYEKMRRNLLLELEEGDAGVMKEEEEEEEEEEGEEEEEEEEDEDEEEEDEEEKEEKEEEDFTKKHNCVENETLEIIRKKFTFLTWRTNQFYKLKLQTN